MHKTTGLALSVLFGLIVAFLAPKVAWARDVAQPQLGTDYVVLEQSATRVKVRLFPDVNFTKEGVDFFAKAYGTTPFKIREAEQGNTLPLCRRDGGGARAPQVPPALRSSDAFWDTCDSTKGEKPDVYLLPGVTIEFPTGVVGLPPSAQKELGRRIEKCTDSACILGATNEIRMANGLPLLKESSVQQSPPSPAAQTILAELNGMRAEHDRMRARLLSLRAARVSFDNTVAIVVILAVLLFFALVLLGLRLAHVTRAHDALVLENASFRMQSQDETEAWGKYLTSLEEALDLLPVEEGVDRKRRLTQYLNILKNQVHLSLVGMNELLCSLGAETVKAPQVQVPLGALARAVLALRKQLGSLAGHDPDQIDGYTPSFEQIAIALADREGLAQEERARLVSNHEAVVLEREAAHTRFNDLQKVVDETFRRAKQFAKAAQEWVGADACSVPTELAQVPQVIQSINAVFAELDNSLQALSEELGSRYYHSSLTSLQNLNLLKTWILSEQTALASEREAEERFRADLTRLCAVDEEGVVLDRARLIEALEERVNLHNGNLNALALAERRLLARSIAGWSGESGTDPGSLQVLVGAAQSFARDARRFEREIGRAIQDGATAFDVDLDEAQPLRDQLKHVLAAAIQPPSLPVLASRFMQGLGVRVTDPVAALRVLVGYSDDGPMSTPISGGEISGVVDPVALLRQNPGVAFTLNSWTGALLLQELLAA